ncbi:Haloacid dehalogenase-like hydrolase domain-containing protein 2 [Actinomortierella ambigua]|nr:Haloacid dehalogenase-like hydrolase domain-containing protein 2 [Actinomortierella ambigua]
MLHKTLACVLIAILPIVSFADDCRSGNFPVKIARITSSPVKPGQETCVTFVATNSNPIASGQVKITVDRDGSSNAVYDKSHNMCTEFGVSCPIAAGEHSLTKCVNVPYEATGKFKLVTNTSKTSTENLTKKLQKMGFNVSRDDIITSLAATRMLVEKDNLKPFLILEPKATEEFDNISVDASRPYDAVVVGLAPSCFHYDKLNEAFRILKNAQAAQRNVQLIAIHRGRYFQDTDDDLSMGPGGFVAALEYAAGVQAKIVGKPNKTFFETAINALPSTTSTTTATAAATATESTTIVIGDDVESDLGPETDGLPIERFLVKTGKYRAGDEDRAFKTMDGVFADFAHTVPQILKRYGVI